MKNQFKIIAFLCLFVLMHSEDITSVTFASSCVTTNTVVKATIQLPEGMSTGGAVEVSDISGCQATDSSVNPQDSTKVESDVTPPTVEGICYITKATATPSTTSQEETPAAASSVDYKGSQATSGNSLQFLKDVEAPETTQSNFNLDVTEISGTSTTIDVLFKADVEGAIPQITFNSILLTCTKGASGEKKVICTLKKSDLTQNGTFDVKYTRPCETKETGLFKVVVSGNTSSDSTDSMSYLTFSKLLFFGAAALF